MCKKSNKQAKLKTWPQIRVKVWVSRAKAGCAFAKQVATEGLPQKQVSSHKAKVKMPRAESNAFGFLMKAVMFAHMNLQVVNY